MKKTILFVGALAVTLVFAAVSQTPAAPKHRVVFQLTEPQGAAWDMVIGHVQNMRTAFAKDGSEVEVVFLDLDLTCCSRKTRRRRHS
jgi:hypothetical protein